MTYLLVRYAVRDYDKWRAHFDADLPEQQAAGINVRYVLRDCKKPNTITFLAQITDKARAYEHMCREDSAQSAKVAGIRGKIENYWLKE